jgi:transcription-repair coupling factor (superfamily II helicase)
LGAEQSGFISDLGYETYQKILNEAMAELRNETSPDPIPELRSPTRSLSQGGECLPDSECASISSPLGRSGEVFVADCNLESDLEMYFPDQYVPSDSERMLLYRELDNTRNDQELEAYRQRLIDRFGPLPHQAEELLHVVTLRRHGKALGCEKIMLKQGRMFLYFVGNPNSPFYQSDAFGRILDYIGQHVRRCNLREKDGKRSMVVTEVPTVEEAVKVLKTILPL